MTKLAPNQVALVVGAGAGLSASIARQLSAAGVKVGLAARNVGKLAGLAEETGATLLRCDAALPDDVRRLFTDFAETLGQPDIVIFNASSRLRGSIVDLDPSEVQRILAINAFGAFLVGQAAAKAMVPRGSGVIIFTGASASIKGFPGSAPFAMGRFASRGLAQSMARELGPKGIHVAHVVIDGGIRSDANPDPDDQPASRLDPEAIAETYVHIIGQPRSAWTHEVDLRPWSERF